MRNLPKVLLSCPTSSRHSHLIDRWIKHLDSLTYPIDVLLVDTSDNGEYFKRLKKLKVHGKKINVDRMKWEPDKRHILQHLTDVREHIRRYALKNNFDFLFSLDDDIFVPKNAVQKLISRNKELVGFYVHIYNPSARVPCVQKEGGFQMNKGCYWFSFAEIDEYKKFVKKYKTNKLSLQEKHLVPFLIKDKFKPDIVPVWSVGVGCLMIRRDVLEKVPFMTHDTFIWGEDNWFFQACEDKKIQFWLDTSVRPKHLNTNWSMITEKCKQSTRLTLAIGPTNAKEAVRIE